MYFNKKADPLKRTGQFIIDAIIMLLLLWQPQL